MLVGRFILRSLRGRVARTLNIVYPTRALDSDSKLPEEILRASFDYSAANVISSGIVSPKARSFEKILGRYRGPLLIFNGIKDPLGNVRLRTTQLKDLYPAATVVTIDAGCVFFLNFLCVLYFHVCGLCFLRHENKNFNYFFIFSSAKISSIVC